MKDIVRIDELDVVGKKVLVRVDFNVPITRGKIVDTSRIERIIPTIKYLIKNKAKVILLSHFGRPKGQYVLNMSLAPLVDCLQSFLSEANVKFAVDCLGGEANDAVGNLEIGEVLLLENLRFYPGEEGDDVEFAKELASYGDIYVNDAFSCSHRSHASITSITKFLPSCAGLLLHEEVTKLAELLNAPKKPMATIIGGSKISTKLGLLEEIVSKTDLLVIGGGMANTFLKAKGVDVAKSLCEDDLLIKAREIMVKAEKNDCCIILPIDVVIASSIDSGDDVAVTTIDNIPDDKMILDLGPRSIAHVVAQLENYQTILWNGPVGAFEFAPFNVGTEMLAREIALLTSTKDVLSIAGGGDVVASLKQAGLKNCLTYLSTAGGAFLEWLEGKEIPGIKVLN